LYDCVFNHVGILDHYCRVTRVGASRRIKRRGVGIIRRVGHLCGLGNRRCETGCFRSHILALLAFSYAENFGAALWTDALSRGTATLEHD
jgi:hypothetical protein